VNFRLPLPDPMPRAFSVRAAREHGISEAQLRNPAFVTPFHGTRIAPGIDNELSVRCAALATRLRPGQVFSHVTAAMLHGMPLPRATGFGSIQVTSQAPLRAIRHRGTIGHQSHLGPEDVLILHGLLVTSPERTWCDLSGLLGFADLVAAGDSLLYWKHPQTTIERLRAANRRYASHRGEAQRSLALQALSPFSRSRPESHLRVALHASRLPNPIPNYPVYLAPSRRDIEIDLAFPRFATGIEYQGDHHRTDRAQWRKDIGRANDAADAGWSLLYFTGDDTRDMPALLSRVEFRLRSRGWVDNY
jgi:hypothetical protein